MADPYIASLSQYSSDQYSSILLQINGTDLTSDGWVNITGPFGTTDVRSGLTFQTCFPLMPCGQWVKFYLPTIMINSAGTYTIKFLVPGKYPSNGAIYTVVSPAPPAPTLTSVCQAGIIDTCPANPQEGTSFTAHLNGSNFESHCYVLINGGNYGASAKVTVDSATRISVVIPGSLVTGTMTFQVVNSIGASGQDRSGIISIATKTTPTPSITSLTIEGGNQSCTPSGSCFVDPAYAGYPTILLRGSNFAQDCMVNVDTGSVANRSVGGYGTEVRFAYPSGWQASVGTHTIEVVNPSTTGAKRSNQKTITIVAYVPPASPPTITRAGPMDVLGLAISSQCVTPGTTQCNLAGSSENWIFIYGSNFTANCGVKVNGTSISATVVGTGIRALVPSYLCVPNTDISVIVTNSVNGLSSNAYPLHVGAAPANVYKMYISSITDINGTRLTEIPLPVAADMYILINGSPIDPGTGLNVFVIPPLAGTGYTGTPVSFTRNSPTQLKAKLYASLTVGYPLFANPGTMQIYLRSNDPNYDVSNFVDITIKPDPSKPPVNTGDLTITSVTPTQVTVAQPFDLAIFGTGFGATCRVSADVYDTNGSLFKHWDGFSPHEVSPDGTYLKCFQLTITSDGNPGKVLFTVTRVPEYGGDGKTATTPPITVQAAGGQVSLAPSATKITAITVSPTYISAKEGDNTTLTLDLTFSGGLSLPAGVTPPYGIYLQNVGNYSVNKSQVTREAGNRIKVTIPWQEAATLIPGIGRVFSASMPGYAQAIKVGVYDLASLSTTDTCIVGPQAACPMIDLHAPTPASCTTDADCIEQGAGNTCLDGICNQQVIGCPGCQGAFDIASATLDPSTPSAPCEGGKIKINVTFSTIKDGVIKLTVNGADAKDASGATARYSVKSNTPTTKQIVVEIPSGTAGSSKALIISAVLE